MQIPLTATIITKDEEANIDRCLASLGWVGEVVVADSGSTDRTLDICHRHGCRVIETEWRGYGPTKQLAADAAVHDWILSVDADEEVTRELRDAVAELLRDPTCDAYRIRRRSFYLGRLVRHSGWNRDYPVRLFHRGRCRWNVEPVHESLKVPGRIGTIRAPLLHYTYPTVGSHVQRMSLYAELGAARLYARGRRSSILGAVIRGGAKFLKMYLFRGGFLDGKTGFVLACNSAFGAYLKYLKLWEMTRQASST